MIKTSLNLILAAFSFIAFATTLNAQSTPPPLMFSEMNGTKLLDNGMEVPIWGYGLSADGFITVPGPLLQYETGDQVNLAFTNPSPESHTIHLHGLDVDQANDGVPTTSFMVVTGQVGEYAFTAPHPGTYLYHCHVTTTLHLTMGMYGMILVRHPDGILYDGGSTYHSDAPLLFSDLEIETNLTSVQSFPFHDIRPDYFMVNGLSGTQLEDGTQILSCPYGEQLALRLGSMAYTRVKVILPEEWNPTCLMTDGRPLPESFSATELDIYPGERFTVLITPPVPDYDGTFEVQYWDMVSGDYESSNYVRFRDASLDIEDAPAPDTFTAYPNPAQNQIRISSAGPWVITDITGREIMNGSDSNIDVSSLPQGKYTIRGTDLDRGTTFVIQR